MPDSSEKIYKIPRHELRQLIPNIGAGYASDRIVVDGLPVGYVYREAPHLDVDSGWWFFSRDESQEYVDDPSHLALYEVNTICNCDPAIIPYLGAPVGTAFGRIAGTDQFEPEEFIPEEEGDDE